jgi:hypothetical protein
MDSRLLLVSLIDPNGRPLLDADVDDVVIRDGGHLRDALSVRLADYPIALVVNNGRGADRDLEPIRRATLRFVERVGHRPIALTTTNPPRVAATFDHGRAFVIEQLDKLRKGGSTDLFQAMMTAARAVQDTGAPSTAIIVVTADPVGIVPADFQTTMFNSRAKVHIVTQQKASNRNREIRQSAVDTLVALVDETHGQLITIHSPDLYQSAMDRLANLLATELMVEYLVPSGESGGKDVRLGLRISGAKISSWTIAR